MSSVSQNEDNVLIKNILLVFRRKTVMAQQNFRCAGCGMAVAPGKHIFLFFFVHFVFNVVALTILAIATVYIYLEYW